MMNSDVAVNQAFDALDEMARIIRGQQTAAKCTKGKNAAVWHALMFAAVSKSINKIQAVKQRLQEWINHDLETCVPLLLGEAKTKEGVTAEHLNSNNNNNNNSISAASSTDSAATTAVTRTKRTVDEAAVQRICDSFTAYKKIAFAATVIFEVVHSSATNKLDIKTEMLTGYRDKVFAQVDDLLFAYIIERVDQCRAKEDIMAGHLGNLLKTATGMFRIIANQYPTKDKSSEYYGQKFVRRYHDHALKIAGESLSEYLQQPGSLGGLLSWAQERIEFESNLITLFIHDEDMSTQRFSLRRFQIQLEQLFVAPYLEAVLTDASHGFMACLAAGNKREALNQQYSWAAKFKDQCPKIVEVVTQALEEYARQRVSAIFANFNEQTFESVAAAATFIITALFREMQELFGEIISSVSDSTESASLSRPIRKALATTISKAELVRRICDPARGSGVVHETKDHFAELFCMYMDLLLRDPKQMPQGHTIHTLCRGPVSDLFSVLEDRDLFAEHYRLRLARRLLQSGAGGAGSGGWDEDAEHSVLEVLQRIVGKMYTHKFEGMLFDITSAQSEAQKFQEHVDSQMSKSSAPAAPTTLPAKLLEPRVLTAAFWPTIKRDEFVPPQSLAEAIEAFERYYRRKHPTRQLRWQSERGTAVLSVAFPKGQKEIACTVYQAAAMLGVDAVAANKNETTVSNKNRADDGSVTITIGDLAKSLGLEMRVVLPIVASMMLAKGLNLLRRTNVASQTARLSESDALQMNPEFSLRLRKLKLPTGARVDEDEKPDIDASRAQMLDSAIVRVMKSRKTLTLAGLVELVMPQVSRFFVAQPKQVKSRVEFLISKEFLERDSGDFNTLNYLA